MVVFNLGLISWLISANGLKLVYPIFGSTPFGRLSKHSLFDILVFGTNFFSWLEVHYWIDFVILHKNDDWKFQALTFSFKTTPYTNEVRWDFAASTFGFKNLAYAQTCVLKIHVENSRLPESSNPFFSFLNGKILDLYENKRSIKIQKSYCLNENRKRRKKTGENLHE